MVFVVIILAIIADGILGEPKKWHPLAGFGSVAQAVERISDKSKFERISPFLRGLACWLMLVVPFTIIAWQALAWMPLYLQSIAECLILYFTIGWKSMQQHAKEVHSYLIADDIQSARQSVSKIVSRETKDLNEEDVARGAVEAVIENGSDCVLSPIFWFVLLGAPGALMFRLANTLDAMWGNKTEHYIQFGRASARIDDILNWVPARLTALGYAMSGNFSGAMHCMKTQKAETEGPNAGLVMAAGGGALGIKLGGSVVYHGQVDERPVLGRGRETEARDILRAIWLVWHTIGIWLIITAIAASFAVLRNQIEAS